MTTGDTVSLPLVITPDTRLAGASVAEYLCAPSRNVLAGNRAVSYALFVSLLLARLNLMPHERPITRAERQLLLHLLLRDSNLGWPATLRSTTLCTSLDRLFGEWRVLNLTDSQLEERVMSSTLGSSSQLLQPLWKTWQRYRALLQEKSCCDCEDAELALAQALEQGSAAEMLNHVFGGGEQLREVVLKHFLWPTPLQRRIFAALKSAPGLKVREESDWLNRKTPFADLRHLILSGGNGTTLPVGGATPSEGMVCLFQARDPRHECREVVRIIKEALMAKVPSWSCGVVLDNDPAYQRHLLREFQEQGVPYDMLYETRLRDEPLCRALLHLLSAASQRAIDLPALLREPLLNPEMRSFPDLALRVAEYWPLSGATAEPELWMRRFEALQAGERLKRDYTELAEEPELPQAEDFWQQGRSLLLIWQERLQNLAAARDTAEILALLSGILRELDWPRRAFPRDLPTDDAFQQRRRTDGAFASLQQIFAILEHQEVARGAAALKQFREALELMLSRTSLRISLGQVGGVQVLPVAQLPGRSFRLLIAPHAVSSRFPENRSPDWLMGESVRRSLGLFTAADDAVRQRELFATIFSSADERLVFSQPMRNDRGADEQCSAFVNQVAQLRERVESTKVEHMIPPESALSVVQWRQAMMKRYSEEGPTSSDAGNAVELSAAHWYAKDYARALRLIHTWHRHRASHPAFTQPTPEDRKALELALHEKMRHFQYSVSSMQAYRDCPYRFLVEKLLSLRPMQVAQDRLQPYERGLLYHQIVQELLTPNCLHQPSLAELPVDAWSSRLEELIQAIWLRPFSVQLSPVLWRLEQLKARSILGRWLEQEQSRPRAENLACEWTFGGAPPGMPLCSLSETCPSAQRDAAGSLTCRRATKWSEALRLEREGRRISMKGIVDRIDLLGSGVHLIDYKSGQVGDHTASGMANFRDIQLPIYALAWDQYRPETPAQAISYIFLEQREAEKSMSTQSLVEPFKVKGKVTHHWPEYREALIDLLFQVDERVAVGDFRAKPRDKKLCTYCSMHGLCPHRNAVTEEEGDDAAEDGS